MSNYTLHPNIDTNIPLLSNIFDIYESNYEINLYNL